MVRPVIRVSGAGGWQCRPPVFSVVEKFAVITRTAFQHGLWNDTERIHPKDAPGDTNMMSDPNRLERFAEQFAIAAFLAFVSSGAAMVFVLVTTFADAI
jgi:hypothetical protein